MRSLEPLTHALTHHVGACVCVLTVMDAGGCVRLVTASPQKTGDGPVLLDTLGQALLSSDASLTAPDVPAQDAKNEDTSALIETVNKTGKAFLITTDLSGRTVARIACGGFLTQAGGFPITPPPTLYLIGWAQTGKDRESNKGNIASTCHTSLHLALQYGQSLKFHSCRHCATLPGVPLCMHGIC